MTAESVLSRKLRQGGVARSPLPDTDMIGETFARSVEDRLRPLLKTIIGAMVVECRVVKLGEALQSVSVPAMLGVIDVEDAETPGLVNIDTNLAYHLVDLTLGGDPGAAPMPTARSFTGVDMAICRFHLEALIGAFGEAVTTAFGRPLTKRIDIRDQRQNISQIRLAPDYVDVLVLSLGLDIGEAARTGNVAMILPLATLDVIRAAMQDKTAEAARARPNDLWKTVMRRAAAASHVTVDAVLHRQRLSVAAIEALRPGQVLEIPRGATDRVELCISQPGGRTAVVATGELGVYQANKVIRLSAAPDRRLREHISQALKPATPPPPVPALAPAQTADAGQDDEASPGA